jgi:hypothetical protein
MSFNAAMSPSCKYNPTKGYAFWQNVGGSADSSQADIGHVFLSFHTACDGQATITLATGVYLTSIGRDIALRLDE